MREKIPTHNLLSLGEKAKGQSCEEGRLQNRCWEFPFRLFPRDRVWVVIRCQGTICAMPASTGFFNLTKA